MYKSQRDTSIKRNRIFVKHSKLEFKIDKYESAYINVILNRGRIYDTISKKK